MAEGLRFVACWVERVVVITFSICSVVPGCAWRFFVSTDCRTGAGDVFAKKIRPAWCTVDLKRCEWAWMKVLQNTKPSCVALLSSTSGEDDVVVLVFRHIGFVQSNRNHCGLLCYVCLQACSGTGFLSYRQPPPLSTDILEALRPCS